MLVVAGVMHCAYLVSVPGQMEREEINEKLSMLGKRMEELKLEIHSATTVTAATFTNFEPSFDLTATLCDKVKAISNEMQELSQKIESEVGRGLLRVFVGTVRMSAFVCTCIM